MNHKWGIKKCKEIIPKYENDEREVTIEILKKLMIKVKNFLLITLINYSELVSHQNLIQNQLYHLL